LPEIAPGAAVSGAVIPSTGQRRLTTGLPVRFREKKIFPRVVTRPSDRNQ
jgi:hypothetical protein